MIDADNQTHRSRLAKSLDFWSREMDVYSQSRKELILNYIGSAELASKETGEMSKEVIGNLMQLAGLSHVIQLAYGNPKFKATAVAPETAFMAPRLQEFLNRYSQLLDLGNLARLMALDSFFGFGICRVANDLLPPRARAQTGQTTGPVARRVSQYNFVFDGSAAHLGEVGYIGDIFYAPIDDIQKRWEELGYNKDVVDRLEEFRGGRSDNDYRIHNTPRNDASPQAMTRLLYLYLPDSNEEVIWPANNESFGEVAGDYLIKREWTGHADGPYSVLSLLDTPDNIIPVPRAASTLKLHLLFNEMLAITSEQAKAAKVNPVFETGSDKDAKALDDAKDRAWVPVSNLAKVGTHTIPGPDPNQTQFMSILLNMFKEFSGNLDDQLGLAPTAGTATQSSLIRQRTSAMQQESVRRMNEFMEFIGRKLGHLALNDPSLRLTQRAPVQGTDIQVDMSFLPPDELPHTGTIDDFLVTLEPYSMPYRSPDERLALLGAAIGRITQVAQTAVLGVPIDLEEYITIESDYNGLPEIKTLYSDLLPMYAAANADARATAAGGGANKPNGQYTRRNISEGSTDAELFEGMQNLPALSGSTARNVGTG